MSMKYSVCVCVWESAGVYTTTWGSQIYMCNIHLILVNTYIRTGESHVPPYQCRVDADTHHIISYIVITYIVYFRCTAVRQKETPYTHMCVWVGLFAIVWLHQSLICIEISRDADKDQYFYSCNAHLECGSSISYWFISATTYPVYVYIE